MDPLNWKVPDIEKMLRTVMPAFRHSARTPYRRPTIPRVFSNIDDDVDDAPYSLVGARLHPRNPLRGSAIAIPEPDEELDVVAVGRKR